MYYGDKRRSKVNIMEALSNLVWTIFGFKEDKSDSMTDYYDPADWDGIATKNGYTLCIDISEYHVKRSSGLETYEYTKTPVFYDKRTQEKIDKLQALADDPAASKGEFGEVGTALKKIEQLKKTADMYRQEAEESKVLKEKYPTFQANPGRCNWHIEKDGNIIDKGIGAFSFHYLPWEFDCGTMEWNSRPHRETDNSWEEYKNRYTDDIQKFKRLIEKLEKTVSVKIGEGSEQQLEKVIVTEYKTELQAKELDKDTLTDYIKAGTCFKLLNSFNYGCYKGNVYKITDTKHGRISSNRLNQKLTKVLTGYADTSNRFNCDIEKFQKWVESGAIAIVEIVEVKTPYTVEKWIKKTILDSRSVDNSLQEQCGKDKFVFILNEDVDTRDNSPLWVVKVENDLTKDDFIALSKQMKNKGGYYSRFKHGFIFKNNPADVLRGII